MSRPRQNTDYALNVNSLADMADQVQEMLDRTHVHKHQCGECGLDVYRNLKERDFENHLTRAVKALRQAARILQENTHPFELPQSIKDEFAEPTDVIKRPRPSTLSRILKGK